MEISATPRPSPIRLLWMIWSPTGRTKRRKRRPHSILDLRSAKPANLHLPGSLLFGPAVTNVRSAFLYGVASLSPRLRQDILLCIARSYGGFPRDFPFARRACFGV